MTDRKAQALQELQTAPPKLPVETPAPREDPTVAVRWAGDLPTLLKVLEETTECFPRRKLCAKLPSGLLISMVRNQDLTVTLTIPQECGGSAQLTRDTQDVQAQFSEWTQTKRNDEKGRHLILQRP
jgi:hypothetical protein